ncbi:hypothetical protein A1A1_10911 [Planococcus antarcticus DSM 14505]|uniref:Uncharacterized protein n=1 Tax=Planococcus antarcticus DSM 14505 TaxID=1185653 RepID=A0AA87IKR5_9BACL|nr:hypothetical protein A1A1_10911 [Planococcus antarcticus DSM 14505]
MPNILERPRPVITSGQNDFKFDSGAKPKEEKATPTPLITKTPKRAPKAKVKPKPVTKPKSAVGKHDIVKSIKVPHELHTQIGVLGKFMDENKTYAILSTLVDYYVKGELTDRQKKQFEYMTDFFNEDDKE